MANQSYPNKDNASNLRDSGSLGSSSTDKTVSELKSKVSDFTSEGKSRASDITSEAKSRGSEMASDAMSRVSDVFEDASGVASDLYGRAGNLVRNIDTRMAGTIAIAVGVGLVGFFIGRANRIEHSEGSKENVRSAS